MIEEADEAGTGVGEHVNGFEDIVLEVEISEIIEFVLSVED